MILLAELLSDHLRGSLRIQESGANDQPDDLLSAAVIALWPRAVKEQALGALLEIGIENLVITLAGKAILLSGHSGTQFALAFDEHRHAPGQIVLIGDPEAAALALKTDSIIGKRYIHENQE